MFQHVLFVLVLIWMIALITMTIIWIRHSQRTRDAHPEEPDPDLDREPRQDADGHKPGGDPPAAT